jgi:hypothetical protein
MPTDVNEESFRSLCFDDISDIDPVPKGSTSSFRITDLPGLKRSLRMPPDMAHFFAGGAMRRSSSKKLKMKVTWSSFSSA